ncbi:P1 family peptidase [Comamonas sp. GB3 AK4-5]|uniref:DmpA family aminopeptidase n=1 Tax=Comamonas sp. GB3 AK4-5 TaxID=3231487 RepID=UPI00351F3333
MPWTNTALPPLIGHTPLEGGAPRARDLGLHFAGVPGPWNAITDVPGVEVGCVTLLGESGSGKAIRTGVTAILPRGRQALGRSCAAGLHSLNGNGELTGSAWIEESGGLAMPILLSNTHSVGACHHGSLQWVLQQQPQLGRQWLLPVVGETWDGYLNDINGQHVLPEHAALALESASSGAVPEGAAGGGTGMNCYAFKAGNGTASRQVRFGAQHFTVGVFLQANFGVRQELRIGGVDVGAALAADNPLQAHFGDAPAGAGSCLAIVATDAPLLPLQCKALARRVGLGIARTGTCGSHFSGDLFMAFSTANAGALDSRFPGSEPEDAVLRSLCFVPWGHVDALYTAVVEATEEAVVNALVAGRSMVGLDGRRSPGIPHAELQRLLAR